MLVKEPYVHLIAIDLSKAFDMVWHEYLAAQLAELPLPEIVYNWVVEYLEDRSHRTKFNGIVSAEEYINSSIVQGSGLGPVNFLVTISKFKTRHATNRLFKYADDGYLIVPASGAPSIESEMAQASSWAAEANLKINLGKTQELIIGRSNRSIHKHSVPLTQGLKRVEHLKILGVTLSSSFTFGKHIDIICSRARQAQYAVRVLSSHGLHEKRLHDVVRSTIVAGLLYSSASWWGFVSASERRRLQAILNQLCRLRYLQGYTPAATVG